MVKGNTSSMGNSRTQRINQAKFGDITVRYGKEKRSNVNKKVPSSFKTKIYGTKLEKKGFTNNGPTRKQQRISKEYHNRNRITLSRFIALSIFVIISCACVWFYAAGSLDNGIQRQKRSLSEIINDVTNKYIATGYSYGQSAAAWTRQLRSRGAHSDDMSNPHNGVSDNESIVQKVLSDFAKLVKTESEGYTSE
ncbi:hypothetical protein BCR32DRAFT_324412 [Anaeromyces robustus]|uniref:Uncharacterized protein n=1 Tax=Anaeromyces robustus TaxID=1754192 RepID=A0A1Y1XPK4_9FUNG|nr:hypothetical protein BCR32DRAFT_324412 [Anaeromyces robustus]|eukprot:ORX87595.1 hypothetical protein BCR32DRAFT_324412 [Anaeromyces robustus]